MRSAKQGNYLNLFDCIKKKNNAKNVKAKSGTYLTREMSTFFNVTLTVLCSFQEPLSFSLFLLQTRKLAGPRLASQLQRSFRQKKNTELYLLFYCRISYQFQSTKTPTRTSQFMPETNPSALVPGFIAG